MKKAAFILAIIFSILTFIGAAYVHHKSRTGKCRVFGNSVHFGLNLSCVLPQ